jgi:glycosyltransferase involved in cell wall biosynthesis
MKIGINASFLRKQNTGLGQVTLNFLKKLSELESEKLKVRQADANEYVLYLEEDVDLELLTNHASSAGKFKKHVFLPKLWKRDDLIRKIMWEKYSLPKKAREDGCDFFISMYQCPTTFENMKIRHLMVVHDLIPKLFPHYLGNSRKKLYWNLTEKGIVEADRIISVSKRTEKDLVQHLGIDPARITTSYIDVDEIYKKEVSLESGRKVLERYGLKQGFIYHGGGLEVRKNAESVLRAYKKLRNQNKKLHFVHEVPQLVISGKLMPELAPMVTDVERIARELNISQYVKCLGFVPQNELPALYANASMFVFPSHYEGFGLPVLEAMNQGTPVITSKTSSLPEVGGDSVLYCDPGNVDDIAMVMRTVLTDKYVRGTLEKRGRERAMMFSWEKFTNKILHIIPSR